MADAFEAVVGAIYIDSSYEEARKFILHQLKGYLDLVKSGHYEKDYKTLFQEYVQQRARSTSNTNCAAAKDRTTTRPSTWKSKSTAKSWAKDREKQKDAEQHAAHTALMDLKGEGF